MSVAVSILYYPFREKPGHLRNPAQLDGTQYRLIKNRASGRISHGKQLRPSLQRHPTFSAQTAFYFCSGSFQKIPPLCRRCVFFLLPFFLSIENSKQFPPKLFRLPPPTPNSVRSGGSELRPCLTRTNPISPFLVSSSRSSIPVAIQLFSMMAAVVRPITSLLARRSCVSSALLVAFSLLQVIDISDTARRTLSFYVYVRWFLHFSACSVVVN